jgi:hypothetical protein
MELLEDQPKGGAHRLSRVMVIMISLSCSIRAAGHYSTFSFDLSNQVCTLSMAIQNKNPTNFCYENLREESAEKTGTSNEEKYTEYL